MGVLGSVHSLSNAEGGGGEVKASGLVRVGDKLISRQKIDHQIDQILEQRARGLSQQQVAAQFGIDRTFISRLESLGEVRKGRSLALIGFPVANKEQLASVASEEALEFVWLMTNAERWDYVAQRSGLQLVQEVMGLIAEVRRHDALIFVGSDQRSRMVRALVDREVIALEIGKSPITEDQIVDPERLRALIRQLRSEAGGAEQ
jgi:predicted XRE-type DNA-binding protein